MKGVIVGIGVMILGAGGAFFGASLDLRGESIGGMFVSGLGLAYLLCGFMVFAASTAWLERK